MPHKNQKKRLPPLFVIKATIGLRDFLVRITRRMLPASFVMLEEASNIWKVKSVEIAATLNIAGHLKNNPLNIEKLAELTATNSSALYRVLRALAGEGIFKELPGKIFKNTRLSKAIAEQNESVKYFIMHHLGDTNWDLTGDLMHCVKTGNNAFEHKFLTTPFEFLEQNPEKNNIFNKAMTETAELSGSILVNSFPFGQYSTIIDIGGGQGYFLAQILSANPSVNAVLFDQPHVVNDAKETLYKYGVENRCSIVEGNFFETLPNNGDLYIMKNILHDWDDTTSVEILKSIHKAMPQSSRLLLIETIIKADNKPSFGKFIDIQMLIGTQGGKERTLEEFTSILSDSGFSLQKIIDNATPFSFIEAIKA